LPDLEKQIRRAQVDPKNPSKQLKNPKVPQDFRDCAEYGAGGSLRYYAPEIEEPAQKQITVVDILRQRKVASERRRRMMLARTA
jgi:hypothetical protein